MSNRTNKLYDRRIGSDRSKLEISREAKMEVTDNFQHLYDHFCKYGEGQDNIKVTFFHCHVEQRVEHTGSLV